MARICAICDKRPRSANLVSHAKNRTKRRFLPNLHMRKFWLETENRWVRLKISAKGIRIVDKLGIDKVVSDLRSRGEKV